MRGLPYGFNPNVAHATALDLALSTGSLVGGMLAVPISISSSMALRSYSLWNTDTASLRTASARLYVQDHDNPAVALTVADSLGNWSFTPTAASGRESSEVGIFLAPGTYWLAIVNSSTAQTFGIGRTVAPPDFAQMAGQFHALLSLSATSIDLNAGWTRFGNGPAVALNPYAPGSVGAF